MKIEIRPDTPEQIRQDMKEEEDRLKELELNRRLRLGVIKARENDARVKAWEDIKEMCEGLK